MRRGDGGGEGLGPEKFTGGGRRGQVGSAAVWAGLHAAPRRRWRTAVRTTAVHRRRAVAALLILRATSELESFQSYPRARRWPGDTHLTENAVFLHVIFDAALRAVQAGGGAAHLENPPVFGLLRDDLRDGTTLSFADSAVCLIRTRRQVQLAGSPDAVPRKLLTMGFAN